MTTRATFPAIAAVTLLLSACAGVLESSKPARQVYLLQPPEPPAGAAATGASLILAVAAVPGLDTDRILVLGRDAQLYPVGNAHWADNLPEVMTSLTRRSLAESGRFGRVAIGAIARPDEWHLEMELQAFYGIEGAAGTAERVLLRFEGALRCGPDRHRIVVEETTSTGEARIGRLVEAHQQVLDDALRTLPGRIADACGD